MKRKKLYALILTIVCLLAFAIPSFASEPYASQQIMSYSISASSSNNYIDVEFDVLVQGEWKKSDVKASIFIDNQGVVGF